MIIKWIHINDVGGDPWVLPILSALEEAIKKGKVQERPEEMRDLPLYIKTRLTMLPRIFHRINIEARELYSLVKLHESEHVCTHVKTGYALNINEDLIYKLLIDIDAFLFEINSCTELITKFFSIVCRHVGKEIPEGKVGKIIKKLLASKRQDMNWFKLLDEHRNFFMHEGTPYIAIDVSNETWDLIIMKESLTRFDDATKFIMFSDLREIVRGFQSGNSAIQNYLIELYRE